MPDAPRVVVTNTTPLIALALIGKLHLLHDLYGEVLVPPAVYAEVLAGGAERVGIAEVQAASWLRVRSLVLGYMDAVQPLIKQLQQGGIRLSKERIIDFRNYDSHGR